jgi:glutathione synthase/RimK-type ligase-like ATP-grasp enzyme
MQKIGLLTCSNFPDLIPSDQKMIPMLQSAGFDAQAVIWNDDKVDWSSFDALVFRNTWDYYELANDFILWLDEIESLGIPTFNPISTVRKNLHKFYLQDFQQNGITIIPSIFIPKGNLDTLVAEIPPSWDKLIIKPAISAGAYLTVLFDRKDIDHILDKYRSISQEKDLIIQPFIPQIQDEGEISLVFFDKVYAHAVIKRPKSGDFRIQSQFGGVYSSYLPSSTLLQTATEIVQTIPEDLLYARVDGLMIDDQFHLMELELVEPDLYFDHAVDVQKIFVDALIRRLH